MKSEDKRMKINSKTSITTDELCGRLRREQRLFDHETPMQLEFHMWVRSAIRRLQEPHTPADARQVFEEWLVYRAPFVRPLNERRAYEEADQRRRYRSRRNVELMANDQEILRKALVYLSRVKISGRTVESVLKENLSYG